MEAAGQRCTTTGQLLLLGGNIHETSDFSVEIDRRIGLMRACLERFGSELYDMTTAPLSLKSPNAEGRGG